ncbi:MAG TPA: type II toxin-antitoxin system HicB family antitoxin [Phycisphaerae bacterium]|nr:type II toxin-antitoxin system HicB family antitoxin [Phycisphaerae bacterium]
MKIAIRIVEVSGGVFRASCPALPGCTAAGTSPDAAKQALAAAISGYLCSFDAATPRFELSEAGPGLSRLAC